MTTAPDNVIAVDTSVSVPLLIDTHPDHEHIFRWAATHRLALAGHATVETYAVLTRLPGSNRLAAADAVRAMTRRFPEPLVLTEQAARDLPRILADRGIVGGATYDGMVALAAAEHGATLATRDERARRTYETLGVSLIVVA